MLDQGEKKHNRKMDRKPLTREYMKITHVTLLIANYINLKKYTQGLSFPKKL